LVGTAMLLLASGVGGMTVAGGQYMLHDPPPLTQGITTNLTGAIIAIDGKEDARRQLWVRLTDAVGAENGLPTGSVVRISIKNTISRHEIGNVIWPHAGWDDTSSIMCLPIARVTADINFHRVFR
ncbi:MAG: hypothetical protein VW472_08205, partial [Candidatus Puniceispirillum sp.]